MSRMIPQETVDALRRFNDVSVDLYGIDCTLFVLNNATSAEPQDVYRQQDQYTYTGKETKVFIEWSPDNKRLRKMGIYAEENVPIIAWFKNIPDVKTQSYLKVPVQYVPNVYDTDEFEVINISIKGMHDAEVLKAYKLAPRRVKQAGPPGTANV